MVPRMTVHNVYRKPDGDLTSTTLTKDGRGDLVEVEVVAQYRVFCATQADAYRQVNRDLQYQGGWAPTGILESSYHGGGWHQWQGDLEPESQFRKGAGKREVLKKIIEQIGDE